MSQEVLELVVKKVNNVLGEETLTLKTADEESAESEEEQEEQEELALLNFDRPMIILTSEQWKENVAKALRDDPELQFDFLSCVTGVDYDEHMEVVYNFYSTTKKHYLYVKVRTSRENPSVISVDSIWKAADYMEREIYDLLGIDFPGHWNLKRILLQDEWEGHPLRKDYITDKKALGLD
ncbi:NADH-quinone oxidoreductase subunit C [Evansella cellulosilytica]|uniref:NADH-quinone oxidoreductase n=1 Tax=Evansella cellulosilytica (strain ATCC 21833 / DSM 2522 / FERM P-1141 / JCM 9156 / N-4) TaxID=649639 RepID=E6TX98_EVAC2|nr:NADH-quinone oxidoreductase subunit C [Evansella cellulosilytica]ADU32293.1 NADH (or F420H2) dehydrogenase, subunit C [Evansella cellulosilytica DSM 2522]